MSEWVLKPLSKLAILHKNTWKVGDEEAPYIALEHIEEGKLRLNGVSHSSIVTSNKYWFSEQNFLFGRLRPYFRKVVKPQFRGICSTDIWVIGAVEGIDLTFLFYLFANQEFIDLANSGSSGTKMPRADWNFLKHTKWLVPEDIEEQRAIANVLSSLDDKIDLLHRQNQTLEALAQTLFRQWFIEEAEDDWEEGTLDSIITVKGGTTPSTKNPAFWNGKFHWTTPRDLSNYPHIYLFDTERKITKAGLEQIGSGLLPMGTLLLSSRAPIGYLAIAEVPIAINQGYIAIINNKGFSKFFIYFWIKENLDYIKNHAGGSTFLEISKSSFKKLVLKKPPFELRAKFDQLTIGYFEKIKTNIIQIRTLEKLRDTLLPKLMSGEVRVKEKE